MPYSFVMSRNAISLQDASSLLSKLTAESIPVVAMLVEKDGTTVRVSGFVRELSGEKELTVVSSREEKKQSFLRVVLSPACLFEYGDKREIPETRREFLSQEYGDTALSIFLPTGGVFFLFFNL